MRNIDDYILNINEKNVNDIRQSIIDEINSPAFVSSLSTWKQLHCEDFESLVITGIVRSFIKVNKKVKDFMKLKNIVINKLSMNIPLRNKIINLIDNYDYSEFKNTVENLIDQKLISKYRSI